MPVQGTWRVEVEALIGDFDKLLATVDVPISGP